MASGAFFPLQVDFHSALGTALASDDVVVENLAKLLTNDGTGQ